MRSEPPLVPAYARIVKMAEKNIAKNRKAKFDYEILETFEAGLALQGSEIKSIRAGQISIKEAYVRTNGQEAWLINAHIAPYDPASSMNHEPKRERKLLLHRKEITSIWDDVRQKGVSVIPLRVYLKHGRAKVEIGVGRGKRKYDKRQDIAKRDAQREIDRALRGRE